MNPEAQSENGGSAFGGSGEMSCLTQLAEKRGHEGWGDSEMGDRRWEIGVAGKWWVGGETILVDFWRWVSLSTAYPL